MAGASMTRISDSDQPMHGPRKILVCGYPPQDQDALLNMLPRALDREAPVVFCLPADGETLLGDLLACEDLRNKGVEGRMPRAVIMSGLTQRELRQVMTRWKELSLPPQMWAAATPTSETWTLRQLITELQRERLEMQQRTAPSS